MTQRISTNDPHPETTLPRSPSSTPTVEGHSASAGNNGEQAVIVYFKLDRDAWVAVAFGLLWATMAQVLLGWASLSYPMGADQGTYAYAGWRILQGEVPYRDFFMTRPPMTAGLHALSLWLFGHHAAAIRVMDFGWVILNAALLGALAWKWFGSKPAAKLSAPFYVLLHHHLDYWHTAQADVWLSLPIVLALLILPDTAVRGAAVRTWLTGTLFATAVLFKYTALPFSLVFALLLWRTHRWASWRPVAVGVTGALTVCVLFLLWLHATSALTWYAQQHADFTPGYVQVRVTPISPTGIVLLLQHGLASPMMAGIYALALLCGLHKLLCLSREHVQGARIRASISVEGVLWIWFMLALATVWVQGKLFPYHHGPMLAPLALIAARQATHFLRHAVGRRRPVVLVGALLGALLMVLATPLHERLRWSITRLAGSISHSDFQLHEMHNLSNYSFASAVGAAQILAAKTPPEQPVLVWGRDPAISFLAHRKAPGRFLYNYHFRFSTWQPWLVPEFIRTLSTEPPAAVVVAFDDRTGDATGGNEDSRELLDKVKGLSHWLHCAFELEATLSHHALYLRRASPLDSPICKEDWPVSAVDESSGPPETIR